MRVVSLVAACLLGVTVASGAAQKAAAAIPKDTYTDTGKPLAPSKALDAMIGMLETQVMSAADAMPAEKYSFQPTAAIFAAGSPAKYDTVRTFAEELTHIAQANYFFYSTVNATAVPAAAKQVGSLKTKEEVIAALKASFAYAHAQIATITPANAFLGIEGADGMHTPATVAAFGVAHGYDHYGQIVEYLRMNGVVPAGSK